MKWHNMTWHEMTWHHMTWHEFAGENRIASTLPVIFSEQSNIQWKCNYNSFSGNRCPLPNDCFKHATNHAEFPLLKAFVVTKRYWLIFSLMIILHFLLAWDWCLSCMFWRLSTLLFLLNDCSKLFVPVRQHIQTNSNMTDISNEISWL